MFYLMVAHFADLVIVPAFKCVDYWQRIFADLVIVLAFKCVDYTTGICVAPNSPPESSPL